MFIKSEYLSLDEIVELRTEKVVKKKIPTYLTLG